MSDLQVLDRACEDWTWPMWLVIEKLWFLLNLLILFIILSIQAFMSLCHKYSHFAIDTQFHLPQATTREWFWPFFAFNLINRYEIETHSQYWLEIVQRLIQLRSTHSSKSFYSRNGRRSGINGKKSHTSLLTLCRRDDLLEIVNYNCYCCCQWKQKQAKIRSGQIHTCVSRE